MNRLTPFAILILALTACATAPPVQEMSDARQAIRAAEAVGAAQYAPENLTEAQALLRKAQTDLETGAYETARRYALDARVQAIKARQTASKNPLLRSTPVQKKVP
ncbi:MAG TPA: hypothetical protein DCS21_11115 [Gammaproteobacteria bacterium]|nr:hypothetical protein [Gammaproteobacteria bacterium]